MSRGDGTPPYIPTHLVISFFQIYAELIKKIECSAGDGGFYKFGQTRTDLGLKIANLSGLPLWMDPYVNLLFAPKKN